MIYLHGLGSITANDIIRIQPTKKGFMLPNYPLENLNSKMRMRVDEYHKEINKYAHIYAYLDIDYDYQTDLLHIWLHLCFFDAGKDCCVTPVTLSRIDPTIEEIQEIKEQIIIPHIRRKL